MIGVLITTNLSPVLAEKKGWHGGQWFLGKCGVIVSRIFHVSFASACYLSCFNFRKRFEQLFSGYEDNIVIKKDVSPRLYSNVHIHTLRACTCTRTLPYSRTYTRIVSVFSLPECTKSISSTVSKRLVFLRTRLHRGTRDRTSERTLTGNVRIGTCVKGPGFARKLLIAQLRILIISGHVIAVSAQQRDNEKGV